MKSYSQNISFKKSVRYDFNLLNLIIPASGIPFNTSVNFNNQPAFFSANQTQQQQPRNHVKYPPTPPQQAALRPPPTGLDSWCPGTFPALVIALFHVCVVPLRWRVHRIKLAVVTRCGALWNIPQWWLLLSSQG